MPMTTILLVEDKLDLAQVIARELTAENYTVYHAGDGLAALDTHAREHPDLVILDWMLPKLDGLEVLRRLRQAAPTPVLMLTARGEEMDRVVGLEVGADDYLAKPFSMRELVARVRAILRRAELDRALRQPTTPEQVGANGLTVQPGRRRVEVDGTAVTLKPREFDLLAFLARHPGQVFSRAQLLTNV